MSIISELFVGWRDNRKSLPYPTYSGHWLTMYLSLSVIFIRYWVLSILPFFSSPKRGIQDVHVESNQGTHTLHLVSGAFDLKKFKALFTPHWIRFAPARKPYRIGLLFTPHSQKRHHSSYIRTIILARSLWRNELAPRRSLSGESRIGEEFTPFGIAFRVSVRSYPV